MQVDELETALAYSHAAGADIGRLTIQLDGLRHSCRLLEVEKAALEGAAFAAGMTASVLGDNMVALRELIVNEPENAEPDLVIAYRKLLKRLRPVKRKK